MARKLAVAANALYPVVFGKAPILSDQGLFLHASLSQLSRFPNVICFVSHTTLAFLGHGDFHRHHIGMLLFRAWLLLHVSGLPHGISQLHRADGASCSGSSPLLTSLARHPRLQYRFPAWSPTHSASGQDLLALLTPRNHPRAQDISNFSGGGRTQRVKPHRSRNRVWPSFLGLWSHACSWATFENYDDNHRRITWMNPHPVWYLWRHEHIVQRLVRFIPHGQFCLQKICRLPLSFTKWTSGSHPFGIYEHVKKTRSQFLRSFASLGKTVELHPSPWNEPLEGSNCQMVWLVLRSSSEVPRSIFTAISLWASAQVLLRLWLS